MKKLIMSAVATAMLLTTSASAVSFNTETKANACKNFENSKENFENHYAKYRTGTDMDMYVNISGTAQGIEKAFSEIYGSIDVNYLKNLGVGVSTKATYKNFVLNYIIFIDKLIANDLTKEYINLVAINEPTNKEMTIETAFLMNNTFGYMNVREENFLLKDYIVQKTYNPDKYKDRSIKKIIKLIFLGKNFKAVEEVSKWRDFKSIQGYCSAVGVTVTQ